MKNWIKVALLSFVLMVPIPACFGGLTHAATLPENTTSTLGSSATFTSDTYEVGRNSAISVVVKADQNGATNGVKIDQSTDNDCVDATSPTFQYTSEWTYTASDGAIYVAQALGKCFRVRYINGSTEQGSMDLTVNLWGIQ